MMDAIIVDVDGTLALRGDRSPYDMTKVLSDRPNQPVIDAVKLYKAAGHQVIIMSGRLDSARADTATWLQTHGVPFDFLFMRPQPPAGVNHPPDQDVKLDLFRAHVDGRFNVRAVFDDRLRVVRMWHSLGLPLFRVGDPDADF